METNFTKGKWEVYKSDHIGCINVSIGKYDGFNGFVELWYHHYENKQEAKANAKLIAAAPEMVKMLQKLIVTFKGGGLEKYQVKRLEEAEQLLIKIIQ